MVSTMRVAQLSSAWTVRIYHAVMGVSPSMAQSARRLPRSVLRIPNLSGHRQRFSTCSTLHSPTSLFKMSSDSLIHALAGSAGGIVSMVAT